MTLRLTAAAALAGLTLPLTLWAAAPLPAAPAADAMPANRAPVPVENFTQEDWLGRYVGAQASAPLFRAFLADPGLAVLAQVDTFQTPERHWCVARVGLTHSTAADRQPRLPAMLHTGGASSQTPSDPLTGETGCAGRALKRAVAQMLAAPEPLKGIEQTVDTGGSWTKKKADPGDKSWTTFGISDVGSYWISELLPGWFGHAFDYRQVSRLQMYAVTDGDDNAKICVALLGLGAQAPDGRMMRVPVAYDARSYIMKPGVTQIDDSDCFDPAFETLAGRIEPRSAMVTTLINRWDAVAEPGQSRPTQATVDAGVARWKKDVAQAQAKAQAKARAEAARQPRSAPTRSAPRCINPATGLPMVASDGSCAGFDVGGNLYGFSSH